MASEAITRNDLTNILNEVLPFSFTEFRHHTGTATIPNTTLVQVHSETFESGSWLILTSLEVTSGGAGSTTGQNRILENGNLVYSHKDIADNSLNNVNYYVLESASNTTITLEAFQATGNSQTQEWRFTAIRIGDKFAQGEADYIVEQGTDGAWSYKKWNSGEYEAVYTAGFALDAGTAWWTGGYYHKTTYALPLPSFALDWHLKSAQKSDGTLSFCVGAIQDASGIYLYWVNGSAPAVSGSNFANTIVTIIGRWK